MSKKENPIKEKVLEKVEEAKAIVEPTTQEPLMLSCRALSLNFIV